jgi:hypothetical protein
VATWGELAAIRPDIAGPGRAILYQFGVGLAFLATVRPDGGPRVHPVCPVLVGDTLAGRLIPSPKRRDLERDGRFALHSFPRTDDEDALYLTGTARPVTDTALPAAITAQFLAERSHLPFDPQQLAEDEPFVFDITGALLTRTTGHGDWSPRHTVWHQAT